MKAGSYVVQGSASHFIDECMAVEKCIRCAKNVCRDDGWATLAQVVRRKGSPPMLCGGVVCLPCRNSFLRWVNNYRLKKEVDLS